MLGAYIWDHIKRVLPTIMLRDKPVENFSRERCSVLKAKKTSL